MASSSSMVASSSSSSTKKTIVLKSKEGEIFEVDEAASLLSRTVKNIIEEDCISGGIPLPNVDSATLIKVIEYCHIHAKEDDEASKKFDADLVKEMKMKKNHDMLFDLILAANYLDINILLNLMCQTIADMMKGKRPEEIREIFNIINDYSKEEEDEVRKENEWAFE